MNCACRGNVAHSAPALSIVLAYTFAGCNAKAAQAMRWESSALWCKALLKIGVNLPRSHPMPGSKRCKTGSAWLCCKDARVLRDARAMAACWLVAILPLLMYYCIPVVLFKGQLSIGCGFCSIVQLPALSILDDLCA